MRDKYFERDKIVEKYNSRGQLIDSLGLLGAMGGCSFALISIGHPAEFVLAGGGFGAITYKLSNYLSTLNGNMKLKALKNLEKRAA